MNRVDLSSPLPGVVGDRTAKALSRAFGIANVGELLWHLPRRYSRRGDLTPLTGIPTGEHITVVAQVLDVRERQMQRRRGSLLEARITDGNGTLQLTFFNQRYRAKDLVPGARGVFAGKVTEYRGQLQLQHPDYEMFSDRELVPGGAQLDEAAAKAWAETPVPMYPATAQLPSWTIAKAIAVALDAVMPLDDPLPSSVVGPADIVPYDDALELVHRPKRESDWQRARRSLRFREAFELQLALLDQRRRAAELPSLPRPLLSDDRAAAGMLGRFDAALPFSLTPDQLRVGEEISADLAATHPMHRLLQGEVGSGKTLVALRAMLQVADAGGQSALLAPTEVLAAQHLRSITEALGAELAAELHPVLLTGKMPATERKRVLLDIAAGTARIVVGTHALLSEVVTFADLGFVIVDEQHRFGVEQRDTLRAKGKQPHLLAMTATPIPRTVALTAFGDLEVSTIHELPPGRQGIATFAVPEIEMPRRAARVWERAAEEIAQGRQVYVVCPAIAPRQEQHAAAGEDEVAGSGAAEESGNSAQENALTLVSVEEMTAELRQHPLFSSARIAALHGAMPSEEKDRVMRAFAAGDIDVLVATTVIEVGMNVPNATLMVVRDADRFGISQLHQLRGRVGRGSHPGLCLLMTRAAEGTPARERIDAIAATDDGFALAEIDLELRREGDVLGTEQSGGRSTLKLLRVAKDGDTIVQAREAAAQLLAGDPALRTAPLLERMLTERRNAGALVNLAKS